MSTPGKILITGARGFLGTTLMVRLKELGFEPVAFEGDVRDFDNALRQMSEVKPVWVVHTAAKIDVAWSEQNKEEAHSVNVGGTKSIVTAASAHGARVLFISTSGVFSGAEGNYTEEDIPTPSTFYGQTKVAGEQLVQEAGGLVLRLILLGVHPNGNTGKNFFEWIVNSANNNVDLTLFNDQYTNSISNVSTADFIAEILKKNPQETILHLGTRDTVSKYESALEILKHFPNYSGTIKPISVDAVGDNLFRPKQMWLNTKKAASILNPMPAFFEEIHRIVTRNKEKK